MHPSAPCDMHILDIRKSLYRINPKEGTATVPRLPVSIDSSCLRETPRSHKLPPLLAVFSILQPSDLVLGGVSNGQLRSIEQLVNLLQGASFGLHDEEEYDHDRHDIASEENEVVPPADPRKGEWCD